MEKEKEKEKEKEESLKRLYNYMNIMKEQNKLYIPGAENYDVDAMTSGMSREEALEYLFYCLDKIPIFFEKLRFDSEVTRNNYKMICESAKKIRDELRIIHGR